MTGTESALAVGYLIIYIILLFTVAMYTFRKGRIVLFIVGIFFPILWLIGAILPAKEGSRYDIEQAERYNAQMRDYTR